MRLAPSFVFLRLDSAFFYLQISFVFQTDSLHQFLFKACPPSGVRGLLTHLFPICLCGSHHPPVRLVPSFVFPRLDSAFFYLQISLVFQTDSLHQFLFKACPPSGVRGLLTYLFPIRPCVSHHLPVWLTPSARVAHTICPCGSHHLPVRLAPLVKLKSTNNLLFISTLASTFLCLRFVIPSFIVRLLFLVEPL